MRQEFKLNIVPNKSKTYMLPLIAEQFNFNLAQGLVNTYLSFDEKDEVFCLLYKWSSDPAFLKFEGELMKNHLFVGHQDYNKYTVYKFRLSRHMKAERDLMIKGKYKDFSDEHKKAVMNFLENIKAKNKHRIEAILSKHADLTSLAPDIKNETFVKNIKVIEIKRETFKD